MADLKNIVYISNENYETLVTNGSVTVNGTTITYDANDLYITPEESLPTLTIGSVTYDGTEPKTVTLEDLGWSAEESVEYRPISVNGTSILESSSGTALNLKAGSNVTLTGNASGDVTIAASYTDTGATSVETTGAGNAVTSASYNASTRKITLTKGTTFLTSADAGDFAGKSHTHNFGTDITNRGEAFLAWGGKNFSGSYGPIDAAMIPSLGANRLAFSRADGIEVEYSRDAGATWTDYNLTDAQKTAIFSGPQAATSTVIGKPGSKNSSTGKYDNVSINNRLRITITTDLAYIYTQLNKFVIYCSTSGSNNCKCIIDAKTKANCDAGNDTWVTFADSVDISGWPGFNVINTSSITTYGNNTSQYKKLRFTFYCNTDSSMATNGGLQISNIYGFGGVGWTTPSNMAKWGQLYTYDYRQNVTFPAGITTSGTINSFNIHPRSNNSYNLGSSSYKWANVYATNFYESGTSLTNKYIAKSLVSTKGDLIYASAANTPARLGIGLNGQFLSIDDGTPKWVNIPSAGFEDVLEGITGRTKVEWNALNAGEYGSNSTYNGTTLPPVILESNSGFWNSASGRPLDVSFHFTKKEKITTLQVKCPPYNGTNPTMTVYYAQSGDTGLTLYREIATISTADSKTYKFNEEGISADYWVVRFTASNWIDLRLCNPRGSFTTGLYTEECHQQIMDKFNRYQPLGNYVTINTAQTITGSKSFSNGISLPGIENNSDGKLTINGGGVAGQGLSVTGYSHSINGHDITLQATNGITIKNTAQATLELFSYSTTIGGSDLYINTNSVYNGKTTTTTLYKLQAPTVSTPVTSNDVSVTTGLGTSGQALLSNGTNAYWGDIPTSGGSADFGYTEITSAAATITGGDTYTINPSDTSYKELIFMFSSQDMNDDVIQFIGGSYTTANIPICPTLNGVVGVGSIHLVKLGTIWYELSGNYLRTANGTITIQIQNQNSTTSCDISVYGR